MQFHEPTSEAVSKLDRPLEVVPAVEDWPVQPERVRVWIDPFHRLCVSVDGREFHNVRPRKVFPLTGKADYVSFVGDNGKEAVLLAHPDKLDPESRRALETALERMYYVAKIKSVQSISEKMGVSHWQVMTDRGYAAFEVADRTTIRKLPGGRIIITDVDGNRFEIECVDELDERSRALVYSET